MEKNKLIEGAKQGREKIEKNPELFGRFVSSLTGKQQLSEKQYKLIEDFLTEDFLTEDFLTEDFLTEDTNEN